MADDDVQEFSKDNPPTENGVWYRRREVVHAFGPFTNVKVGGKLHKGSVFIVDDSPLENKQSKIKAVDATDFREEFTPASDADIPRVQGPHFDAHEASKEQATGQQFDEKVEGDDIAAQVLAEGQN